MNRVAVILLLAIAWVGCDSHTPDFYYTQNDLKYQYHDIVGEGKIPVVGDYLTVYMQYKTSEDSIFFDSQDYSYTGKQLIILGKPTIPGGIEEGFAQLMEGDSVTFFIESGKFFGKYLQKEVPPFLSSTEEIKITLRLLKVERPEAFKKRMEEERLAAEQNEFQIMQKILDDWSAEGKEIHDFYGVFVAFEDTICSYPIVGGDMTKVKYKGYFPNGKVFYNNTQSEFPDEFKVGVPGQTIEGMKIALLHMCHGQKAKALVPSYYGFNESVIAEGLVPEFTPVIFEIETLPLDEKARAKKETLLLELQDSLTQLKP